MLARPSLPLPGLSRRKASHRTSKAGLVLAFTLLILLPVASALKIQSETLTWNEATKTRGKEVRDVFQRSFSAYKKFAWGHDEVTPLSLNYSNSRNGWGATMIDSLTTLHMMGMIDEYNSIMEHVQYVDFTKTNTSVSVFETTIRYIGAMTAVYEMSARTDAIFRTKSLQLAEKLSMAWQNDSVLPFGHMNFSTNTAVLTDGHNVTNLAEAGSLILEWYKLTRHSDNVTYLEMAEASMKAIMNSPQVYPGLQAMELNPMDASPLGDWLSWGGGADSYYEYLIKYALVTGNADPSYLNTWWLAVDSTIHHLLRKSSASLTAYGVPQSPTAKERWYIASQSMRLNVTTTGMGHLDCFIGGNWLLGGKVLGNESIVDYGLRLTETCADSYTLMPTGIGPETFYFIDKETRKVSSISGGLDLQLYEDWAMLPRGGYYLRPEVIESMFYAYRITGDTVWQDRAWDAFQALRKHCETPEGLFAPLSRVDRIPSGNFSKARGLQEDGPDGWEDGPEWRERPEYQDIMESFWWGETLKYLYLIFAPPDLYSLDEYVFTTEAHPYRIDAHWTPSERPSGIPEPPPSPYNLSFVTRRSFGILFILCLLGGALYVLTAWRRGRASSDGKAQTPYGVVFDSEAEGAGRRQSGSKIDRLSLSSKRRLHKDVVDSGREEEADELLAERTESPLPRDGSPGHS